MATAPTTWLHQQIENGIPVISVLAERLDPGIHKKADYIRILEDTIETGHRNIVLDLHELRYTNHSWGLFQLIFSATHRLNKCGGRLAVCGLGGHPRRAFLFAELNRYLPCYRNVPDAIRGLNTAK